MALKTALNERMVVEVWERQAFDPAPLGALGFRVLFRGVPSDAGGPDYQDALLLRDGRELLQGDIEFHVLSSDWYRHGHHQNPRYNDVILHAVWENDGPATIRENGLSVPTLALSACAFPSPLRYQPPSPASLMPHPCAEAFARLAPQAFLERIDALGRRRFTERADLFSAELSDIPPDQVVYAALLEGLGYASNREVFRRLADAVPYAWLVPAAGEYLADVLLDAAGLGLRTAIVPPARLGPESWRLTRLRPANHPATRLRGISIVLRETAPSLAGALSAATLAAEHPRQLRRRLTARTGDETGIGPGRADEVACSVVLPFVAALEPARSEPLALYLRYPAPPHNRWTRTMVEIANAAGHDLPVRTATRHQGLHYLYTRFCRSEHRRDCPLCGAAR